ncbi:MAG: mercuric transport protein MerTP [Bacteroidota bacterium]|nr:mercuric transport protein MerTP [Bacteroidota bacterium]
MNNKSSNNTLVAGLIAGFAASLCCITPVLALLGGVSGLASSFSWIMPYRLYLIGLTVAIFAFAWYQKLKPKKQVACDCETENKKSFWQSKTFLAIVTAFAAVLVAFPYYAKMFYGKTQEMKVIVVDKKNIQTVQLNISGMDCEACTTGINNKLLKTNGVIEANTSYNNENAVVRFDNSKTSVDSLTNIVNNTGYKVISSITISKYK